MDQLNTRLISMLTLRHVLDCATCLRLSTALAQLLPTQIKTDLFACHHCFVDKHTLSETSSKLPEILQSSDRAQQHSLSVS